MGAGVRLGVVGTGFVSVNFARCLRGDRDYRIASVLTRRTGAVAHPLARHLTRDVAALIDRCDLVVECSGDPIHAAEVITACVDAKRPVVTMNAEFHVTAGSEFVRNGAVVTEAEGDQPGSQAALAEEIRGLGFRPLVFGSMKGFLDPNPTPEDMATWAHRQGISITMTTAFTDGTKLQIEQALVCNGLGATLAHSGMVGMEEDDLAVAGTRLGTLARDLNTPIAEYVLSPRLTHGVFVVAEHDESQQAVLRYLKLGDGPFYVITRNAIFAHLEIMKTVRRVVDTGRGLLDNSRTPRVGVAAVAKRRLQPGDRIDRGIGSFDVRGEAVVIADFPDHAPIGLVANATVSRTIEPGETLSLSDLEVPDSVALHAWSRIRKRLMVAGKSRRPAEERPPAYRPAHSLR